ncbi:MAG: 2-oxoacid:acceptor oxidoreductase family protein [Planctomycetes bacterium]|nr:2-oxoacid:acceptor oxidoreductase family protein [Planctomycetota bacterium]
MSAFKLPARDELGFCNIFLSALGGDGANMGGKLLFKIGCTHFGLDGGYDARYGSEKKGTATDVSVRFCEVGTPVRQAGPTATPHFLVAFHDDLIAPLELGRGLQLNAVCIVNSIKSPEEVRHLLGLHSGTIVCVDATKIAYQSKSRMNMPLIAVLCHELGFPDTDVTAVIKKQWPKAAESNMAAFNAALGGSTRETFSSNGYPRQSPQVSRGPIGWRNMLNGGTIDALTHCTLNRDNRIAGRGRVPKFDKGVCTSCGICLTVCSDPGGLLWRDGRMDGIDDAFCKGCMRCVEVCPDTKKGKALTFDYA